MNPPLLNAADIRSRIWQELQRATQDRHHEWRTPVLATLGSDGAPQARTVVLRQAHAQLAHLLIYTDSRSPKVAELSVSPCVTLVFWSKQLNWQLRVRATMLVQTAGSAVDAAWARVSQSAGAGDYLSASAPGDALPKTDAAPSTRHHLAVLTAQVQQVDWLELGRSGHRRAVFDASTWQWRTP